MHTISLQAGVTPSSTIYMLLILMHCETCNHQEVVYKMFYKMKIVKLWHLTCSRHQSLQIFEFQFSKSYLVAPAIQSVNGKKQTILLADNFFIRSKIYQKNKYMIEFA